MMVQATHGIVPFYQADQAIVNTLCSIIDKMHNEQELTPGELEIFDRITQTRSVDPSDAG